MRTNRRSFMGVLGGVVTVIVIDPLTPGAPPPPPVPIQLLAHNGSAKEAPHYSFRGDCGYYSNGTKVHFVIDGVRQF